MFKKILRDYRYVSRDSPASVSRKTVIRGESFPRPNLPDFKNQTRIRSAGSDKRSSTSPVRGKSKHAGISKPEANLPPNQQQVTDDRILISSTELADRLKMAQDEGYNRGLQAGLAAGRAEWEPTAKQLSSAFEAAIAQCKSQYNSLAEEFEKSLIELSLKIAEKIVGDAAARSSDAATANVRNCLAMLGGSGEVTIKLSPSDFEIIKTMAPDLEKMRDGRFKIKLVSDENIVPGGCFVELDGSVIDARIDSQLDNIRKHLSILS